MPPISAARVARWRWERRRKMAEPLTRSRVCCRKDGAAAYGDICSVWSPFAIRVNVPCAKKSFPLARPRSGSSGRARRSSPVTCVRSTACRAFIRTMNRPRNHHQTYSVCPLALTRIRRCRRVGSRSLNHERRTHDSRRRCDDPAIYPRRS
jgi:hypothetical protein